ncbi:F-box/RNI-like superfamily protein [Striga asiatica]|uniref:F-box/RNI-like superfamily protein n=1 Tax=Striga asiatica TaxID=4170 RepID=A0A5A7QH49_STRAF|nr:F-box/RNI-like superfamily protein [Striga asiatica]
MEDRISELPIPLLHHILCFLSQKEAVRTCLLSKQWRHIGSSGPNLDFSEEWFDDTQEKFVSIVDRTLQGYHDQNLSIHKLHLHLSTSPLSQPVISLLDKWILMIPALNIKAFKLNFHSPTCILSLTPAYYESLEELHLRNCKLKPVESVLFKRLCILTLEHVQIDDGTCETIVLDCPLLRRWVLYFCEGFTNGRLRSPGLKHFELCNSTRIEGRSIEIDLQNIETVSIRAPWIWCPRQSAFMFSRLTSLSLYDVILPRESFDLLSFGCPTLERLTLDNCSGLEEFHLASDSVKWLTISTSKILLKGATICVPNILHFLFSIAQVPDTFSFTTTTSKEWDSNVILSSCEEDPDFDVNWWFLELRRLLKALSGSRISLSLQMDGGPHDMPCSAVVSDEPPVVVRDLNFASCKWRTMVWYMGFTNGLFRVCRPSHVHGASLVSGSDMNYRLSEFQLNILLANASLPTETYFWKHDLEQVHVDGQLVQYTNWSELRNRTYDEIVCLEMKWRGQTSRNCETGHMTGHSTALACFSIFSILLLLLGIFSCVFSTVPHSVKI